MSGLKLRGIKRQREKNLAQRRGRDIPPQLSECCLLGRAKCYACLEDGQSHSSTTAQRQAKESANPQDACQQPSLCWNTRPKAFHSQQPLKNLAQEPQKQLGHIYIYFFFFKKRGLILEEKCFAPANAGRKRDTSVQLQFQM